MNPQDHMEDSRRKEWKAVALMLTMAGIESFEENLRKHLHWEEQLEEEIKEAKASAP